ncbi:MAG: hypothetical protein LC768_11045 [Acidobacteria bacterium]|nr:hypothetical protein [Acidobacteriota bacterium]MCA1638849.1 hypothetical protein [Acidobacteriota bacterium]
MRKRTNVISVFILLLLILIGALLYRAYRKSSEGGELQNRITWSERVVAYRITNEPVLTFMLSPNDREIKVDSNLEFPPELLKPKFAYGLKVQVVSSRDEVRWEQVFYETTRKTLIEQENGKLPLESVFYAEPERSRLMPDDTRSTTVLLDGVDLSGAYLRVSLTEDSDMPSAVVRASRVVSRNRSEALRAWKYLSQKERNMMLRQILITRNEPREETIARLMSRGLELLSPEGREGTDYFPVYLYLADISLPETTREFELPGDLTGAGQAVIYEIKTAGQIRITALFADGSAVSPESVGIESPLKLGETVDVQPGHRFTVRNKSDRPIYILAEFNDQTNDEWILLEPIGDTSRYYLIGPGLAHNIEADVSDVPERARVVTRALFEPPFNADEKAVYSVTYRALDASGNTVLEGAYQGESVFEPLDIFAAPGATLRGEVVGSRHVAYIYLPPSSETLLLESDRKILVTLSTELDDADTESATDFVQTGAAKGAPPESGDADLATTNERKRQRWFYFRPNNLRELEEAGQTRLIAAASESNGIRPIRVGAVPESGTISKRRIERRGSRFEGNLVGAEAVIARPEGEFFLEIFENVGAGNSRNEKWKASNYTLLQPFDENFVLNRPGQADENSDLRLKYKLAAQKTKNASPLVSAGNETQKAEGHTTTGEISLPTAADSPTSGVKVNRAEAGDKFFVNRPAAGQNAEVRAERSYFNLAPGRPLSVRVTQAPPSVTRGVNVFLRFDRAQPAPARVRVRAFVSSPAGSFQRDFVVSNASDSNVIFSSRPASGLSAVQRIFVPIKDFRPGEYNVRVEILDAVRAYARFVYYKTKSPAPAPKNEINVWVESKQ